MASTGVIRSFETQDISRLHGLLEEFNASARARCTALVDRNGQLLGATGAEALGDAASFASLTAADFAASDRLAELLGEQDFASVFHFGDLGSMYSLAVGENAILATLFDTRSSLGLVRLHARATLPRLTALLAEIALRQDSAQGRPADQLGAAWADEAEHEIDRLFAD